MSIYRKKEYSKKQITMTYNDLHKEQWVKKYV